MEKSRELLLNKLVKEYGCPEPVAPYVIALLQNHPNNLIKAFQEIHQEAEKIRTESKSQVQLNHHQKARAANRLGKAGNEGVQRQIEEHIRKLEEEGSQAANVQTAIATSEKEAIDGLIGAAGLSKFPGAAEYLSAELHSFLACKGCTSNGTHTPICVYQGIRCDRRHPGEMLFVQMGAFLTLPLHLKSSVGHTWAHMWKCWKQNRDVARKGTLKALHHARTDASAATKDAMADSIKELKKASPSGCPSHPIPPNPIPSNPIPSHQIPSHPTPSQN